MVLPVPPMQTRSQTRLSNAKSVPNRRTTIDAVEEMCDLICTNSKCNHKYISTNFDNWREETCEECDHILTLRDPSPNINQEEVGISEPQRRLSNKERSYNHVNFWTLGSTISLIIVALAAYLYLYFLRDLNDESVSYDCRNETTLISEIKNIMMEFPSQSENTLFTFAAGIHRIYETDPSEPTSFLLFHKDGDETVNCLVKKISRFAAKCLTGTNDVIIINGNDLKNEPYATDSGELIIKYQYLVGNKSIMVVQNLNNVPGNVVKEFHYFCDTYQPLVNKAVYFFIMSTDDMTVNKDTSGSKLISRVEKKFKSLWSSELEYNVLDPLITRMTTNVIPVFSEENYSRGC